MADATRIGPLSDPTTAATQRHGRHRAGALTFKDVLDRTFKTKAGTSYLHGNIHHAAARAPAPLKAPASTATADAALTQAMALEKVPASWKDSLRFIMDRESGGQVGVKNPVHSARGLFQLTAANAHFNPNGAASFGSAVEEAQGGIRYIKDRYGTADKAVAHWQKHHWY